MKKTVAFLIALVLNLAVIVQIVPVGLQPVFAAGADFGVGAYAAQSQIDFSKAMGNIEMQNVHFETLISGTALASMVIVIGVGLAVLGIALIIVGRSMEKKKKKDIKGEDK